MYEPQQHEMQLETTHLSGAEEWYCPTCGRRFIMYGLPGCETLALERGDKYVLAWGSTIGTIVATKIVLDPGDEHAIHSGTQAGLRTSPLEVAQIDEAALSPELSHWLDWLEDVDFSDWNDGNVGSLSSSR